MAKGFSFKRGQLFKPCDDNGVPLPDPPKKLGRPKGSCDKDPEGHIKNKTFRARITFSYEERKRMEWVMKYFDLCPSEAIKMSVNMMMELTQHYEKGFELNMDRKIGKKILRRRVIIS